MEVREDKKSAWISLDISPLFFHIVAKLVQALVITYDEIFQSTVQKGTSCSQSHFWTPPHPPYSLYSDPLPFNMFSTLKKHL
jgi:hypothetical protein